MKKAWEWLAGLGAALIIFIGALLAFRGRGDDGAAKVALDGADDEHDKAMEKEREAIQAAREELDEAQGDLDAVATTDDADARSDGLLDRL